MRNTFLTILVLHCRCSFYIVYIVYNYAFFMYILYDLDKDDIQNMGKIIWICMCNKYEIWCPLKMQSKILYQINFTNINVPFLLINIWFLLYLLQSVTILWRRSLWLLSVYSVILQAAGVFCFFGSWGGNMENVAKSRKWSQVNKSFQVTSFMCQHQVVV